MEPSDVLKFWFEDVTPAQWFGKDSEVDESITIKFAGLLESASKGELFIWRETALGRLSEIIVLDQFSRNIYRNRPEAFSNDKLGLVLAQELVILGLDKEIPLKMRAFAYMPYMHSESKLIHEVALGLFSTKGLEDNFNFEVGHKKIIDRFSRYPHRNRVLNRESTKEEIEFLKTHKGF